MPKAPALLLLAALVAAPPAYVAAQATDPAAQVIDSFDQTLIATMKGGKSLGAQGRYRKLEPAVTQTFDLATMTRFAVGPKWSTLAPADQAALVKAFTRMSVSTYAHNFDSYAGEKFNIVKVETRGLDKLVRTQLIPAGKAPVDLTYRMRDSGGWKIIDVYYNGSISQLTTQRSDFSATMNAGGPAALIKKLNDLSDKLMKS